MRTRVGYSGGTRKDPHYYSLGDHTESIQIDYDPSQISYEDLLAIFWKSHNPTRGTLSRQHMAAIFYHNDEQKRLALESRDREQERRHAKIVTPILPASRFYRAEAYHQKYQLRNQQELMGEFRRIYPDDSDFTDSTAAARVNGYLAGYGTLESLESELKRLGLSHQATEKLAEYVKRRLSNH